MVNSKGGVKDKSMVFLNRIEGKITPDPVIGTVNTEIPFTYTFDKADPCLVGKEVKLSTSLVAESIDQIKLYYVDGEQKENYISTREALRILDGFGNNSASVMIGKSDYILIYDASRKLVIDGEAYLPSG